jgi:hypothetical protein
MPQVNVRYATWVHGNRKNRTSAADVFDQFSNSVASGPFILPARTPTALNDGSNVDFLFWSVTGAVGGSVIQQRVPATPAQDITINVGTQDVVATAWYGRSGGNGTQTGFFIDAFDIQAGDFLNDDFVRVEPDPSSTLTTQANVDGFVSTASAETIKAFSSIGPEPFAEWRVFAGNTVPSGFDLPAAKHANAVAIAFYRRMIVTPPLCFFTFSPDGASYNPGGDTGEVDLITKPACAWTATPSDPTMIRITDPTPAPGQIAVTGQGSRLIKFTVLANPTAGVPRSSTITVEGLFNTAVFTAFQGACTYELSDTGDVFPWEGGYGSVDVTTLLSDCRWTARCSATWVSFRNGPSFKGSGTLSFYVAENPKIDTGPVTGPLPTHYRYATIRIADQTFTIQQVQRVKRLSRIDD